MLSGGYITEVPICKDITQYSQNGIIRIFTAQPFNKLVETFDGVFSTVLYYEKSKVYPTFTAFKESVLCHGLTLYLDILHDNSRADRLNKWGMVIYTDKTTCEHIYRYYPFDKYPKLVIAAVLWPWFANDNGSIEGGVLRCMRYHAMELFPTKPVCMRDADTVFHDALAYYKKYKRYADELKSLIREWELNFINAWAGAYSKHSENTLDQIILGTSIGYSETWHVDVPYPLPLNETAMKKYNLVKLFKEGSNYMKFTGDGLYGGFVNVGADKTAFPKLWTHCIEFLLQRYYMILSAHKNRLISDYFSDDIVGTSGGKDEKLLNFVFLRYAFKYIHFFYIEYLLLEKPVISASKPTKPQQLLKHNLIYPEYVRAALTLKKNVFKDKFNKIHQRYKKFLSRTSPTIFYKKLFGTYKKKKPELKVLAEEYFFKRAPNRESLREKTFKIPRMPLATPVPSRTEYTEP